MVIRRIRLEDWDVDVDVRPAVRELNPLFRAAQLAFYMPHKLAIELKRLPEERANALEARVYAESVIAGSPTPVFSEFASREWADWLIAEPDAFLALRSICAEAKNFDPRNEVGHGDVAEHGRAGP